MKAVIWEQSGSRGGAIKKRPSQKRIQKLLEKKKRKKKEKYDNTTK
jgi:hypothetical protein